MIYAGVDAGSRSIMVVLLDGRNGSVVARAAADQGVRQGEIAERTLAEAAAPFGGIEKITATVATGYGRRLVQVADRAVTEITCHARGVAASMPGARTVIEIGGQDSKVLWLDERGAVRNFIMNDRCAAGTGRFLEMVASRLEVAIEEMGEGNPGGDEASVISSMCVVFAESEIIGLLAQGVPPERIVAGVQRAIAERVVTMTQRRATAPVVFTGGVALVSGMSRAIEAAIGQRVRVAPDARFTGALGAALIASSG